MNTNRLVTLLLTVTWIIATSNLQAQVQQKQNSTPQSGSKTIELNKKGNTPPAANKPTVQSAKPISGANLNAEDIIGYWLTAQKGTIIEFYKNGDRYDGKVAWSKTLTDNKGQPVKDVNNPDKSKRNNNIVGSTMITGLKYNPKTGYYEGGKVYQPQTGKTFDCKIQLSNKNSIKVTSGLGFISKTLVWTRTSGIPGKH